MHWIKKWLLNFNSGKTELVSFERSKNSGATDAKMDESVKKSSFRIVALSFYLLRN